MTALVGAVVVVGLAAVAALSLSALSGFKAWLLFRRETAKSAPVVDSALAERVEALEKKLAAAELLKMRRA